MEVLSRTFIDSRCGIVSDGYVIASDGYLKKPEQIVRKKLIQGKGGYEDHLCWENLSEDDLMLSWQFKPLEIGKEPLDFQVVHRPTTITEEQKERITEIRQEILLSCARALDFLAYYLSSRPNRHHISDTVNHAFDELLG